MHKYILPLLLFLLVSAICGCSVTAPSSQPRAKATPLANIDAFAPEYREAARTVTATLEENGEKAEEFYADVETGEDGQVMVFHLWHESAFEPENRNVSGNPGGKCRDMRYDVGQRKVMQTLFWQ